MKIAIGLVGYECSEHLENALKPWIELRKDNNIFISLVHGVFPETHSLGYPTLSKDGSHILMEGLKLRGLVDHVQIYPDALYEYELRNIGIKAAQNSKKDFDYFILVDADEIWTIEQIKHAYEFAQMNNECNWFKVNFKNYVIKRGCWVDDFIAPRIWDFRSLDKCVYDNDMIFKDGVHANNKPHKVISSLLVDHYSWIGSPEYLKRKEAFQRIHHHGLCSFKWVEELNRLDFDYNYYYSLGKEIPELKKD